MPAEEIQLPENNESSIDIFALIRALWVKRKLISIVVGVATLFSIAISFVLSESFLATTVILPETDKSKLSSLGGLSDLASLAGVNVGGEGTLVKLYPTILKSESVLRNVIFRKYQTKEFSQPVNLIEYWEIKEKTRELEYENALKNLRDLLQIAMDAKTAVITMSILMPEPQLAADIVNEVSSELDKFIRNKRTTSAGEQRKFVEGRLTEVKRDLTLSENILKEFREKNRQVLSPQLLLEQERLIRDVQINATIYTELRKQYELVKIEEVKNIPVINVMDIAHAAARKDKPKRAVIVIVIFILSFFMILGKIIVEYLYGKEISQFLMRIRSLSE
ncbi:MAG: Wzz/FepE/Etk N-terminal domain-containing protein [Bacteroidota bacterium]